MTTRVLIVDDSAEVRAVVRGLLQDEAVELAEASSGEEAMRRVDEGFEPELVVCDVRMPGGDGPWLVERLMYGHPDVAIVMLCPIQDAPTAVRCLELGADRYLLKPPDPDELRIACARALELRALRLGAG